MRALIILLSSPCLAAAMALSTPRATPTRGLQRRELLLPALAAIALPAKPAQAAELTTYKDARYGVSFGVPGGWNAASPQQLGDGRRLVLATDPDDESTNVFVAFTPIRPDYSSLGSFGNIDYVANTVLPQCGDLSYACSFEAGDQIDAKMISKETVKGCYVYDYTIQQRGGPKRHLRSLFTIQADGGSSLLVGLTAQCLDGKYSGLEATFKQVLNSYKGA